MGALNASFLVVAIHDSEGYYAVWIMCLVAVAFDSVLRLFVLRLIMVEKKECTHTCI